ncbi:5'(3')-deoxyribonucleotidase [Chitinophaga sp. W2I13]
MEFPLSLAEKHAWLSEHFPFISWKNIVFCGSKTIVEADYMIDDHDKNLSAFKGTPLLFTAPHNLPLTDYKRVNNWEEVAEYFELSAVKNENHLLAVS